MSRRIRLGLALLVALLVVGGTAATSLRPPRYRPPVAAPILDPFRAPSGPYAAGNRGIDYDTAQGQWVGAIGLGSVTFAGKVANVPYVTITHPDGLRSTYSLAAITVVVGQRVRAGQHVGRAAEQLHLGVRRANVYIDPASIFAKPKAMIVATRPPASSPASLPAGPSR